MFTWYVSALNAIPQFESCWHYCVIALQWCQLDHTRSVHIWVFSDAQTHISRGLSPSRCCDDPLTLEDSRLTGSVGLSVPLFGEIRALFGRKFITIWFGYNRKTLSSFSANIRRWAVVSCHVHTILYLLQEKFVISCKLSMKKVFVNKLEI